MVKGRSWPMHPWVGVALTRGFFVQQPLKQNQRIAERGMSRHERWQGVEG